MAKGELIVSGTNSVELELAERPQDVRVYFKFDCDPVPCNPGTMDVLEYVVLERPVPARRFRRHKHQWILVISWVVSGTREIVWHVRY